MRGRTPGKRMAGVRLVTRTGGTPTFGTHLIRNVFRLVDNFPIFYGLGLVMTMITAITCGWGTWRRAPCSFTTAATRCCSSTCATPRLDASTAEIVNELLRRWDTLDTDARTELARKVLRAPDSTDDMALQDPAAASRRRNRSVTEQLRDHALQTTLLQRYGTWQSSGRASAPAGGGTPD